MSRPATELPYAKLGIMFFAQWMGFSVWMVPLTLVLNAHGLQSIQPFAFATVAVAALVSPLFFGAMADRQVAPIRILRWLALAAAAAMALASTGIQLGWNRWLVLLTIQILALCVSPTVSLSTTIALSALRDPRKEYGPVRATGTIGWMAGCWLVSALDADASTLAGYSGSIIWLFLAAFTFLMPAAEPTPSTQRLTLRQRLGLDALTLLKQADHRVVFLTAALFTIPLAAFYPYTPPHLRDVGFERASAWMSLGQTTEILAMFTLGALIIRFRLKWILAAGLIAGLARYLFCSLDEKDWLLAGVALHGLTYTLFFTTAQIYVNERVPAEWRARAQALLTLLIGGVGHLIGYLSSGWWFRVNTTVEGTNWPLFWQGLAGVIAVVMIYFLAAYRGNKSLR